MRAGSFAQLREMYYSRRSSRSSVSVINGGLSSGRKAREVDREK
jgi:hypothetical protein